MIKPEKKTVSFVDEKEITKLSGMELARIRQLKRKGAFLVNANGLIEKSHALSVLHNMDQLDPGDGPMVVSRPMRYKEATEPARKAAVKEEPEDAVDLARARHKLQQELTEARIKSLRVESDAKALRNAREAGILVLASQVEHVWREMTEHLFDEQLSLRLVRIAEKSKGRKDLVVKYDAVINELRRKMRDFAIREK